MPYPQSPGNPVPNPAVTEAMIYWVNFGLLNRAQPIHRRHPSGCLLGKKKESVDDRRKEGKVKRQTFRSHA